MGLDESVTEYVGKEINIVPCYGWGWSGRPTIDPADPPAFKAHLFRLFAYNGERRGGVARITNRGHDYDGFWVVFATRHEGEFNFTDQLGHYNVWIGPEEPTDHADGWPRTSNSKPQLEGFCQIEALSI